MTPSSRRAGAAAICLLLAVIHTWPLAAHPGRLSRNDNGDAQLNEWIMAWVAHQLPRDPAHLFEANIFYPAHDTLAFSEPLIVPAVFGAPLAWLGASPVLVYNLVLIAGFALTAFAGYLLIEAWTGDAIAGLLTGSACAFNTHTLSRLAHIQGIHIYGLPLVLLLTDRLLRGGSWREALLLAGCIAILAYTSGYLVVFAAVMMAVAAFVRWREWLGATSRQVIPLFLLAGAAAALAVLPVYLPYRRVAQTQHMVRTLDIVRDYSATLKGYLAAAGRIHMATWSGAFFKDPIDSFFPGFVVLGLTLVAIVVGVQRAEWRPRIAMLTAIAVVGVVLSLGTATPLYGWLFNVFPPMQGLRAAARFGNLFLIGVAVLAGLGLAFWRGDRPRRHLPPEGGSHGSPGYGDSPAQTRGDSPTRADSPTQTRGFRLQADVKRSIAIVLVAVVNLEALRAPFSYREFTGIPGIYRMLADAPGRVVLAEQPFYPRWAIFENAPYVLASTAHWRPLMNGYSGYTPDSYQRYAENFWYFPEERSIQAMKDAGVTHVMVHPAAFQRDADALIQRISVRPDLELLAVGPAGIRLYRLKR
jgi:hypothetical protein